MPRAGYRTRGFARFAGHETDLGALPGQAQAVVPQLRLQVLAYLEGQIAELNRKPIEQSLANVYFPKRCLTQSIAVSPALPITLPTAGVANRLVRGSAICGTLSSNQSPT